MLEKIKTTSETISPISTLSEKTAYLDGLVKEIAPVFMTADEVLNNMPIWPLAINVFSACFCMGCSAIYHLVLCKSKNCD